MPLCWTKEGLEEVDKLEESHGLEVWNSALSASRRRKIETDMWKFGISSATRDCLKVGFSIPPADDLCVRFLWHVLLSFIKTRICQCCSCNISGCHTCKSKTFFCGKTQTMFSSFERKEISSRLQCVESAASVQLEQLCILILFPFETTGNKVGDTSNSW